MSNRKKVMQRIEQRLLKSHHSVSILQLIRQVRYSCDHQNKVDTSIFARSIVPKRLDHVDKSQPNQEYEQLCPLIPKKIYLINKNDVKEQVRRAQSIQHIRHKGELEIVSGSNTARKITLVRPNQKFSLPNMAQRDFSTDLTDRELINPSVGKRSRASHDDRKEEMERQAIAKKLSLNQKMTSLSRWNNNRDPDDEPEPPY